MPGTASLVGGDVGHVPTPGDVNLVGVEQPAQQVRRGRRAGIGLGEAAASARPVADDAMVRISRSTRLWLALQPRRRSSAVTRGEPSAPRERAWMRRISPTSLTSSRWRSDAAWVLAPAVQA